MISALERLRAFRAAKDQTGSRTGRPAVVTERTLSKITDLGQLPMDWRIDLEERAAVLEYGGLSREEADRRALTEILGRYGGRWADSGSVQQAKVTQGRLCRVLEAIGGEPCFQEDVAFDIAGHGFRISFWLPRLAGVVQVIRPQARQGHMCPPSVVPASESGVQDRLVVKSFDNQDVFELPVLECLVCGSAGGPLIFDLVLPAIGGGWGDAEMPGWPERMGKNRLPGPRGTILLARWASCA